MPSRILITGGTGLVGALLLQQLATTRRSIRALVRSEAGARRVRELGAEPVVGDLADRRTLAAAVSGVDRLFVSSSAHPNQSVLQGNLIEAAAEAGVRRVVKLSAGKASPTSPVALKRWHFETEQQIAALGFDYTHVRPNGFMQNTLNHLATIRTEGTLCLPVGAVGASQIDARDVAAVACAALTTDSRLGEALEITGPAALTYGAVAGAIASATGRSVTYRQVSFIESRERMLRQGAPPWTVDIVHEIYRFIASGAAAYVTPLVEEVLGRGPIPFDTFLSDYADAFV
jgi:uncharacterized protein YbjT (DUF2867 family)